MRVMVMVKANEDSEAGVMPSERAADRDGQVQRGARQGRRHAGRRGPAPELQGRARALPGKRAHGDRRAVRRDQGADRRLLAVAGEVDGRGDRVGQALPRTRRRASPRSRSARSSRPRTSATSSRPSCASRRSGCASRPRRASRPAEPSAGRCPVADVTPRDRGGLADRVGAADRRPRAHRARRRPRRGARAGRAGRGAGAVAGVGRPGQPGRLADGHRRSTARSTACAARERARAQARASSAASSSSAASTSAPDLDAAHRRPDRRRPAAADLHRLPPGALDRGAGRADAAPARRPDHRRDRARVPGPRADDRAADRARQADAGRGAGAVRGPARRRARRRGCRRCSRSSTSSSTRATRRPPATTGCGPALCEEALRLGRILAELVPQRAGGARPGRADGDPGLALARPRRARPASRSCCSTRTARAGTGC